MIVLDTNVISALMKSDPAALGHLSRRRPDEVVLVAPVAAEIRHGLERLPPGSRRRELLEREYQRLRAVLRWADWDEAAAMHFGVHKAALERRGERVDDMDVVIGAAALGLGASLATANTRHFSRWDGLALEDWTV